MSYLKITSVNTHDQSRIKIAMRPITFIKVMAMSLLITGLAGCGSNESATPTTDVTPEAQVAQPSAPAEEAMAEEETSVEAGDSESVNLETGDEASDSQSIEPDATVTAESETPATETDGAEAPTVALDANAGKQRYETTCKVCHDSGLLQSPKIGDKVAWAPRIAKGIEVLHKHSAEGYNQMPAQASGDVSKEEVYAAVDYLVEQSS